MFGAAQPFRPQVQTVVHPELEGFIRRATSGPTVRGRLFIYKHYSTGNFVIALWSDNCKQRFVDLINLGPAPVFTHEQASRFRQMINQPTCGRELAKMLRQSERNRITELEQEADETKERRNEMFNPKVSVGWTPSRI